MNTRWTAKLLDQIREHAAAGRTMRHTATVLGIKFNSLNSMASQHKIRFHGIRGPARYLSEAELARAALRREIRQAVIEAADAPLYRGGP